MVSGDTLDAIARRFGVSLSKLIEANDIEDPSLIFSGQVLVIPIRESFRRVVLLPWFDLLSNRAGVAMAAAIPSQLPLKYRSTEVSARDGHRPHPWHQPERTTYPRRRATDADCMAKGAHGVEGVRVRQDDGRRGRYWCGQPPQERTRERCCDDGVCRCPRTAEGGCG